MRKPLVVGALVIAKKPNQHAAKASYRAANGERAYVIRANGTTCVVAIVDRR